MSDCGIACKNLFTAFCFRDLRFAEPPDMKGVYVIRVRQEGLPVDSVLSGVRHVVKSLNWPAVGEKIMDRTQRIMMIDDCPIIYIGSAGTNPKSKQTLQGRYNDFAGRHTAMFPLWALVYHHWDLKYGYRAVGDSGASEANLKSRYREIHGGRLPALVYR